MSQKKPDLGVDLPAGDQPLKNVPRFGRRARLECGGAGASQLLGLGYVERIVAGTNRLEPAVWVSSGNGPA